MRVLVNKIKPVTKSKLREEQSYFRIGRSTIDQIYSTRIIEKNGSMVYKPIVLL